MQYSKWRLYPDTVVKINLCLRTKYEIVLKLLNLILKKQDSSVTWINLAQDKGLWRYTTH
jgi:hypothetical protein